MKNYIIKLLFSGIIILILCHIIPGIQLNSYRTAIILAFVLSLLNTFLKPILKIISFPITLITLGAFSLVINTMIIFCADSLVDNFSIIGFANALIFSSLLSFFTFIFNLK